ncbi:hypothetical protein Tco_0230992 [Tanacetum coccineum]
MVVDIEDDIMDPVMQCTTLPSHSGFSQKKHVSLVTEIHTLSICHILRRLLILNRSFAFELEPCQGEFLNLPDHRIKTTVLQPHSCEVEPLSLESRLAELSFSIKKPRKAFKLTKIWYSQVDTVLEHLDFIPCGATTLTKHVVEVRHVIWIKKFQNVRRIGKILISKIWWWIVNVFKWGCIVVEMRCIVVNVNKQWLGYRDGGFGKSGGGCETRGGRDGFEGLGDQLSIIDI